MKLTSSALKNGDRIPQLYSCDGENIPLPLQWVEVPKEAKSLVLICEDFNAPKGVWDHWTIFNLPASTSFLTEGIKKLPAGTKLGKNSWRKEEYGEPCPPDKKHRYFFLLHALDTFLELPNGASKVRTKQTMNNYILTTTELIGIYARPWQKD